MVVFRLILAFSLLLSVSVGALETDDGFNRKVMANEVFYKADQTRDYKLTEEDGAAWTAHQALDADSDGVVSFQEFTDGADLPYPEWAGAVQRNVVYKRVTGEPLLLDIYPPLVKKENPAPVFYYVHGGGWSGGRKEITGAERPLFEALSREGFVCVSVMYRLVKMWSKDDPVLMRDCVVDCRDGLRFLKKHEKELGLDMDRVVVFGSSAGGHLTQLLSWSGADDFSGDPELSSYQVVPAAGLSWFGPSDFRDTQLFVTENLEDKFAPDHWGNRITKTDKLDYAGATEKVKRMVDEVSPVVYLKKASAPLLHIHGDQDVVISPNHAHHLVEQAERLGVSSVRVEFVKGAGHGWWAEGIEPDRKTVEQMSIDFVVDQVSGDK